MAAVVAVGVEVEAVVVALGVEVEAAVVAVGVEVEVEAAVVAVGVEVDAAVVAVGVEVEAAVVALGVEVEVEAAVVAVGVEVEVEAAVVAVGVEVEAAVMGVGVLVAPPAVKVKLALEISKNMLLAHSTFTRAEEVASLGTVIFSEPSLAVPEASVCVKVEPPSVERRIFTDEQLTGDAVVLATSHLTVCCVPPFQVTAVFGAVTAKGPAALVTLRVTLSFATPPPPDWLSRTVRRKVRVRFVVGRYSPSLNNAPLKIVSSLGKSREGLVTAL